MSGRDYWLRVLTPYARDGYERGLLDDHEVVLFNEVGAEVHLSRPQAGCLPVSLVVPAFDGTEDGDQEERRGVLYTMRRGRERAELSA